MSEELSAGWAAVTASILADTAVLLDHAGEPQAAVSYHVSPFRSGVSLTGVKKVKQNRTYFSGESELESYWKPTREKMETDSTWPSSSVKMITDPTPSGSNRVKKVKKKRACFIDDSDSDSNWKPSRPQTDSSRTQTLPKPSRSAQGFRQVSEPLVEKPRRKSRPAIVIDD